MAKLFVLFVGAAIVGSFVVVACVGDDPTVTSPATGTQGGLNSPCFANGTCSDGLSCTVVQGTAKCVPPGDAAAAADASSIEDAGTTDAADARPSACVFTPTTFPCGVLQGEPPFTCYGAASSCTGTLCGADLAWGCFSRRQCSDVNPCCLSTANAILDAGASCALGTLAMTADATTGANCSTSLSCGPGDTRLCQADSHCPPGERCTPIKVVGGPVALDGKVFIGACVP